MTGETRGATVGDHGSLEFLRRRLAREQRVPAIPLGMLLVSVLVSLAPGFAQALAAQQAKRVLIAYAHDPNAPGMVLFSGQLKAAVREEVPTRVEFYDEYLDLDRFDDADRAAQLARYFADNHLPFTAALRDIVERGPDSLLATTPDLLSV